jgi:aspartate-semialdehyde dehydrogenase
MKKYRVGVVGIGAVGGEMVRVLNQRGFPLEELRILARRERDEVIDGRTYHVVPAEPDAFQGLDFAFFAGTEGAKGASQQLGWPAVERGVIVIDNGDDFRMDPRVPLVIPEVNPEALAKHRGFISNPNCSTIIALVALGPLHRVNRIKRFVAATYQAVSGTGRQAIEELENQVKDYVAGRPPRHEAYPHPIAFNLIPKIGGGKKEIPGCTSEECKMRNESRKILGDKRLRATATCVRVPVFNGHSEALFVEFAKPMSPEQAREILAKAPGIRIVDDLDSDRYPMPRDVSGQDDVFVGRIRADESVRNGLALFVAGDNIRKGAATNAVQIAEALIARG